MRTPSRRCCAVSRVASAGGNSLSWAMAYQVIPHPSSGKSVNEVGGDRDYAHTGDTGASHGFSTARGSVPEIRHGVERSGHTDDFVLLLAQVVHYSIDMVNWNDIIVPATSSGAVTVPPGSTFDHVVVAIPALDSKTFTRLKASQ